MTAAKKGAAPLGGVGERVAETASYRPIGDYALIGDCHGSALVSSIGSIDWCCLHKLDADPIFFRLLDADRGGAWTVTIDGCTRISRAYVPGTNVLQTEFQTASGMVRVTDFMPVGRSRDATVHDYVSLSAPCWLVRRFEGVTGRVRLRTRFEPRGPGFSTERLPLERRDNGSLDAGDLCLWCGGEATLDDDGVTIVLDLAAGDVETAVLTQIAALEDPRRHGEHLLAVTLAFWREWIEYSRYHGRYENAVMRSALALKLLTFAPTGALVAAPTTSLPELVGGGRNWDYRYCWLRDASLSLYALGVIGYSGEARRFAEFLTRRCFREGSAPHIMYGIEGSPFLPERELDQLDGYRGSRPVRVGNGAYNQMQLDVHGEILDLALMRTALGWHLSRDETSFLRATATHVTRIWRRPDQGLWEARTAGGGFVHSKAMAWVALDRAIRLFGENPDWARCRGEILEAIRHEGVAGTPSHLAQSFGKSEVDAALLQILQLGLPLDGELLAETVRAVESGLRTGDFVHRYKGDDGLAGTEGAFLITSFWLVDALLLSDRAAEAVALFERLLERANDVGLYAEEIDVESGSFLGNFPQAFTHLALISSATLIQLYERGGARMLRGTQADRARRLVGATEGTKALLLALWRNRSVKLRSSRRSVMNLM